MSRLAIFVALAAALPCAAFGQQKNPSSEESMSKFNYVAFNNLRSENIDENLGAFDAYLEKVIPIMERHGVQLQVYKVVLGGNEHLNAQAITFGRAHDEKAFSEFAGDPDFQQELPSLISIIRSHYTVYTIGPFAPESQENKRPVLLEGIWLKGDKEESRKIYLELETAAASAAKKYGAKLVDRERAVSSLLGLLPDELEDLPPPDIFSIWSFDDEHGYLDDPAVREFRKETESLVEEKMEFWLEPWK